MPDDGIIPVNTRAPNPLSATGDFSPVIAWNGDLVPIDKASARLVGPGD